MARYATPFGTVVESDAKHVPEGWARTDAPLTAAQAASSGPAGPHETAGEIAKTAAESFGAGAIDTLTAPVRLLSAGATALGSAVEGRPQRDPFASGTGRQLMTDVVGSAQGNAAADEYAASQRARAAANPTTAAVGYGAGQIAGSLATGGLAAGAGRAATEALGGGLAGRLAGAATAGAVEGAPLGLAQAGDTAYLQKQQLEGEHALAAAGLGALLGGALRFGGKAAGEAFGAASGAVQPALDKFADAAPWKVGKAISEKAPDIAEKAVHVGLKAAGLTHGLPGYLLGDVAGDVLAPVVGSAIERSSGALGAIAQRGAKLASQTIDSVTAVAGVASKASPAIIPSATAVFLGKHDSPEDAYTARVDELQSLAANNGQGIRDAIQESLGALAHEQPGAVVSMTQAATNGVQYLLSKVPGEGINTGSLTPLSSSFVPPRADMASFARVYAAVMKPATVLADIRRGTVTSDQIDAVKTVYPQWYQDNVVATYGAKLRQLDAKGRTLMPDQQRVGNLLLGTNTGLDSVDLALRVGPAFTPQAKPRGGPRGGGGSSKQPTTPTDAILGAGR